MSDTVIRVEGLGKRYRIGAARERYVALRDVLARKAAAWRRRLLGRRGPAQPRYDEFWALKDISFDVKQGECIGIIGRNGAGKTTLLKLLSRITDPTTGRFRIRGRVASLLSVGTGFHPELTGRENVYLNGAILGMTKREIDRKFDEIVAFAEIEKFLETPVKYYSSGMYMRLAFAVAAHLEPEILIVDEVLAVGDVEFQKKCLGKIGDVTKGGRTVLFVSHDMSAIQSLCQRVIVLKAGKVAADGPSRSVVPVYLTEAATGQTYHSTEEKSIGIVNACLTVLSSRDPPSMQIELDVRSNEAMRVAIDVRLSDPTGIPIAYGSLGALVASKLIPLTPGITRLVVQSEIDSLAVGSYYVSLDITRPDIEYIERLEQCLWFDFSAPPRVRGSKRLMQHWGKGCWELQPTVVDMQARG